MTDSVDIRKLLESWPYDPDADARIVQGQDGRQILQVRTLMGLEQYEMEGRPDGLRPHDGESELEYQLGRLAQAKAGGTEAEFELSPADCSALFHEGTLYYLRYIRLFQLKDWPRTVRDTSRNLRVFDLVRLYARREEDRQFLEKWRPYILRIRGCAAAMVELDKGQHRSALGGIRDVIHAIEGLEELDDDTFKFERERSLTALRELAQEIEKSRPLSELEQLERQLRRAIERQEFELAAQLRDQIRLLKKQQVF
jgi:UvrB/UvrC motif-containing protein